MSPEFLKILIDPNENNFAVVAVVVAVVVVVVGGGGGGDAVFARQPKDNCRDSLVFFGGKAFLDNMKLKRKLTTTADKRRHESQKIYSLNWGPGMIAINQIE